MEQWILNTAGPGGIVIVGVILVLREVRRHTPDILGRLDGITAKLGALQSDVEAVSTRLDQHIQESRKTNGRKSNRGTSHI